MFTPIEMKQNPRRWFLLPFLSGLALMLLSVLIYMYPKVFLLLFVVIPLFAVGLGLALFGLDLWRGLPAVRERVQIIQARFTRRSGGDAP